MDTERQKISPKANWGDWSSVSFFLEKGQVDTPHKLVESTWEHVHRLRPNIGKVIDFGAGDGRFAGYGKFNYYLGLEIDAQRCVQSNLAPNAEIQNKCAFSLNIDDADLCIGNPPFVRNQDLPKRWKAYASKIVRERTGVAISGLANAWQYFFFLALASVKTDGLCALIVPFEWVSRPSVKALRTYIKSNDWNVEVYRLMDKTFSGILTTSSITIINKSTKRGMWSFFQEIAEGKYSKIESPSGSSIGVIKY